MFYIVIKLKIKRSDVMNLQDLEKKLGLFGISINENTADVIERLSSVWGVITDDCKNGILSDMGLTKYKQNNDNNIKHNEYMTFDEARRTRKKIRYIGNIKDICKSYEVFNNFDYPQFYLANIIGALNTSQLNRVFDDRHWEVKKNS